MSYKYNWSDQNIPDWVEWIAKDDDETIYGHSLKPPMLEDGWWIKEKEQPQDYQCQELFIKLLKNCTWQDSLEQRPDEFRKPKPDLNTGNLLYECYLALGWSGGTRAQVLQVLRSAKELVTEIETREKNNYLKAYQELKQLIKGNK